MKSHFERLIKIAMWMAIVFFVIRAAISWEELNSAASIYLIFGYAGEAIGVAAILVLCYEKLFWRYDPFINTPYIAGEYQGVIVSNYDRKKRCGTVKIKQTFLSVEVVVKTGESESRSVSGTIEEIFGRLELIYTYINEPKLSVRDRSTIHFGTATFIIDKKNYLEGGYYTDRNTSGDMKFTKINKG